MMLESLAAVAGVWLLLLAADATGEAEVEMASCCGRRGCFPKS